jgi:hypothetical protein
VKRGKVERGLKDRIFTNPIPLRERVREEKGKGLGNVERNMEGEEIHTNPNGGLIHIQVGGASIRYNTCSSTSAYPSCTWNPQILGGSCGMLCNLLLFSVLTKYQYPMISVIGPPMDDHAIETPIRPLQTRLRLLPICVLSFFFFQQGPYVLYLVYTTLYFLD